MFVLDNLSAKNTLCDHMFVINIISNFGIFLLEPTEPLNLRASNVNSQQLNVSWSEPERRNGILTVYTVYYKLLRDDKNKNVPGTTWKSEEIASDKTTVVLENLRRFFIIIPFH